MTLPLEGLHAIVTAGPTREPIDAVRFLSNYSSGKQGYAIANALRDAGAAVTLVSGPSTELTPRGMKFVDVDSAEEMYQSVMENLPADIAVCVAAVSDYTPASPELQKVKKEDKTGWNINFEQTKDILAEISAHPTNRPELVIGFAAETEKLVEYATKKLNTKNCDVIVANDISEGKGFFVSENQVHVITKDGADAWEASSKDEIAKRIVSEIIIQHFKGESYDWKVERCA